MKKGILGLLLLLIIQLILGCGGGSSPPCSGDKCKDSSPKKKEWLSTWVSNAGGGATDESSKVVVDSKGNVYIVGSIQGKANFGDIVLQPVGVSGLFVAKLDKNGKWVWAKLAGLSKGYLNHAADVAIDSQASLYITGEFAHSIKFGSTTLKAKRISDLFVAKIDSTGEWLWAKNGNFTLGGAGYRLTLDGKGGVYVLGRYQGTGSFAGKPLKNKPYAYADIFIGKLDQKGNWLWGRSAGGGRSICKGSGIVVNDKGFLYVTGSFSDSVEFGKAKFTAVQTFDAFIAKLDTNGSWIWAKQASLEFFGSPAVDSQDNVYLSGRFAGKRTFGKDQLDSLGGFDAFIAKMNGKGEWLWAKSFGSPGDDNVSNVIIGENAELYFTGTLGETGKFDEKEIKSSLQNSLHLMKLKGDGSLVSVTDLNGSKTPKVIHNIVFNKGGILYVTGIFKEELLLNGKKLYSRGHWDLFVWKLRFGVK